MSNFSGSVFRCEQFTETRSDLVMLIREQRIDGDDKFVVEGNGGDGGFATQKFGADAFYFRGTALELDGHTTDGFVDEPFVHGEIASCGLDVLQVCELIAHGGDFRGVA